MKALNWLLELLYPTRCVFCRRVTRDAVRVCPGCERSLPYTKGEQQKRKIANVKSCVAPLYYEGSVRSALLRFKFEGAAAYGDVFGEFVSKCIDENEISCDIITWVPLSRKRLRKRGYDQARLIAQAVARKQGIPCVPLLYKNRNNRAQAGTGSAEKRRANVRGVYEAINPDYLRGARVLLVDDIVTTGATLSECAKMLLLGGAGSVEAAAVARSRKS